MLELLTQAHHMWVFESTSVLVSHSFWPNPLRAVHQSVSSASPPFLIFLVLAREGWGFQEKLPRKRCSIKLDPWLLFWNKLLTGLPISFGVKKIQSQSEIDLIAAHFSRRMLFMGYSIWFLKELSIRFLLNYKTKGISANLIKLGQNWEIYHLHTFGTKRRHSFFKKTHKMQLGHFHARWTLK